MQHTIDRLYEAYLAGGRVTTDSRQITPGCLFFAFSGEHFDGNAFALDALAQGAALAVVSSASGLDPQASGEPRLVVVDDVLRTLQLLAARRRADLRVPVVGITGTNGKTTTKELAHAVLARRYRTAATAGNLNNHLGVPLTLLSVGPEAEMAIVEMGANHPGEIAALCAIADPDCGLITNVGRAHLEGFGGFEGVVRTKTELYRHLAQKGGTAFVNADSERLVQEAAAAGLHTVSYGAATGASVRGTLTGADPYMKFYFEVGDAVYTVQSRLLGAYNFANAMAAVAVGLHFGVEPFSIKEAIEAYEPHNNRSEFRQTARNRLYLDCYNANPSSMAAALDSFRQAEGRKMAIIGGMKELGPESRAEHEALLERLAACGLERIMLVGPEFEGLALPPHAERHADADALRRELGQHPVSGATLLVKGSNSNRLWTVAECL